MNFSLLILGSQSIRKYIYATLAILVVSICLPFIAVFSLGEEAVSFLSSVPSVSAAEEVGFYMGGPVEGNTYAWGNCTYWSYAMRLWAGNPIPTTWGNANTWDERAIRDGYIVNKVPAIGAIFQSDAGRYGHVAYVTEVRSNGDWVISEMNYRGLNIVNKRTFSADMAINYDFIHSISR